MNESLIFPPMVAPTWDAEADGRVVACRRQVEAAVAHPAWETLARHFGELLPDGHEARLDRLVHLADHCWDFRRGDERNLIRTPEAPPPTIAVVEAASAAFGMTADTVPSRDRYDAVLVMGGLVRACFARPAYAARLFAAGLKAPEVAALAGDRPLRGDEHALADALGFPEIDGEAAAMRCGLLSAFGDGRPVAAPRRVTELGTVDAFLRRTGPLLEVFVAAPGAGRERANTRDTFDHWAAGVLRPRSRVLVVTTSIYVPYQACVAVEALGIRNGISVETAGTAMNGPELWAQRFEWFHYLQELGSAARALRALQIALRGLPA